MGCDRGNAAQLLPFVVGLTSMGLLALIVALVVEQFRPLSRSSNWIYRTVSGLIDQATRFIDSYERGRDSWIAVVTWIALLVGSCILVGLADAALGGMLGVLSFALHVAVLYHTVGFRQFSHPFSEFNEAMQLGEVERARQLLRDWLRDSDTSLRPDAAESSAEAGDAVAKVDIASESELCRIAIAHALLAAHRHVFGPLLWYLLLPGAIGPVMFRLADHLARVWGVRTNQSAAAPVPGSPDLLSRLARTAFTLIDWLPLRLSAAGFAIVGNFEDAMYCWRAALAVPEPERQRSVILGAGSGALGVQLADDRLAAMWSKAADTGNPDSAGNTGKFDWIGEPADPVALKSAVGMVWRAVILWVSIFALLTIASHVG
jgi:adenosylcobinamide-phosphate synthase